MHPAYDGLASLPYYDEFDLSTVDVLLISQYVTTCSLLWELHALSTPLGADERSGCYKRLLLSISQRQEGALYMVEDDCLPPLRRTSSCRLHVPLHPDIPEEINSILITNAVSESAVHNCDLRLCSHL